MLTPRSIRRAAERKAAKEARRAENRTPESRTAIAANAANAQLSTGPITPQGKAISSKNALKTGLTGRTVLLPTDDADRYAAHLAAYEKAYRPADELERHLVQAITDTAWRLDRIPSLEEALYFKGSIELAEQVAMHEESARPAMLRLHTYLAYERHFKNLNLQERRLQSQRIRLIAELKALQTQREAAGEQQPARKPSNQKHIQPNGFEFSATRTPQVLPLETSVEPHGRHAER